MSKKSRKKNKEKNIETHDEMQIRIAGQMNSTVHKTQGQWTIQHISLLVKQGKLHDAPYQRGEIWTLPIKKELMETIIGFGGENVPPITVRKLGNDDYELVDGKQRVLTAIAPFVNDDAFKINGVYNPELTGQTCSDLKKEYPIIYGALMGVKISVDILENMSDEEAITYFIRRNSSGVNVEIGERIHAMQGSPLMKTLEPLKKHNIWDYINGKRRYNEYTYLSRMCLFIRDYEKYSKEVTCYNNNQLLKELELYRVVPLTKSWVTQVKKTLDSLNKILVKSESTLNITQFYSVFLYMNISPQTDLETFGEFLPKLYHYVNTSKETDSGLFHDLKRRNNEKGYGYTPLYYHWYVNVMNMAFEAFKQGHDWNEIKRIHF